MTDAHIQPPPVVAVSSLIKQFGRFAALRGVTAQFSGAKLYAILGDNGAGKTTLLRTLAGLSQPTSGQVMLLGAHKFHDVCHHVGYMAHPSLLYDEMSGLESLGYFARLYGITDRSRCAETIRSIPNSPAPLANIRRACGSGCRWRARCSTIPKFCCSRSLFPTSVDTHSATEMVRLLARTRDAGKTVLVVTHQASLLEGAADEFIWMQAGQIIGRTRDLKPPEGTN